MFLSSHSYYIFKDWKFLWGDKKIHMILDESDNFHNCGGE